MFKFISIVFIVLTSQLASAACDFSLVRTEMRKDLNERISDGKRDKEDISDISYYLARPSKEQSPIVGVIRFLQKMPSGKTEMIYTYVFDNKTCKKIDSRGGNALPASTL